jgi:hypothetical protein
MLTAGPAAAVSGGTPPAAGSYGFVARLSNGVGGCTGALIDPQWIITASACFPDNAQQSGTPTKPITVTFGDSNSAVTHVTTLVPRTDRNVVLAKLDAPVAVTPVKLSATAPTIGEALTVAGYGRTDADWVPDRPNVAPFTVASATGALVSLTSTAGTDTCKGDAGGPALRAVNGRVELLAINHTSFQHGCLGATAGTQQGSTETRVDDIADWIQQQILPVAISNLYTKRCLTVLAANNVNEARAYQYDCDPKFIDRVWEIEPVNGGVQIRNHYTKRCLTVLAANNVNEAPAYQYDCDATFTDRVWQITSVTA